MRGGVTAAPFLPAELHGIRRLDDIRTFAIDLAPYNGVWAEFGVAGGDSAKHFMPRMSRVTFHLFDSFEGLPEEWDFNGDINHIGRYAQPFVPRFDDPRIVVHVGMFADTLPKVDMGELDFVHIDCDIYSATKTVFDHIKVKRGTIILFDEYHGYNNYLDHERKAYMEWSERTGHKLQWLGISRKEAVGRVS